MRVWLLLLALLMGLFELQTDWGGRGGAAGADDALATATDGVTPPPPPRP